MARQRYVVVTTTPTGVATSDPMLKGPALESALSACKDWRAQKTTHSVVGTKGEYALRHGKNVVGSVKVVPWGIERVVIRQEDQTDDGAIVSPSPPPPPSPSPSPAEDSPDFQGYSVEVEGTVHIMADSPEDAERKVLIGLRKQRLVVFTKISVAHKTPVK